MSVDFYGCDCCGESRYEEYVASCPKCDHSVCTSCVVNDDINSRYAYHYGVKFDGSKKQKEEYGVESKEDSEHGYEIGAILDDTGIAPKYCPFCNGSKVSDDDLLVYLMGKYDVDKEELKKEYLEKKENV